MPDIIHLLPDTVANQIAAGEVIQRPASVIKELVENAVDAGATTIQVLVVDAGRTSIQVIDNGHGMSSTDARLAFERHATSKIVQADDLFALRTMGFRGEALPSIAAVAQVELLTRMQSEQLGTHLTLAASRVLSQEPTSCPVGCNFRVDNLFFNVPARRKFLKSNATELNQILAAFERIALVYPAIAFTLHSNGSELLNLRAGSLRQRVADVFGHRLTQDLLPVEADTALGRITGFVGKPETARKKGVHQFFFVNGRYMRHPYFHKAVLTAFERLVPEGMQVPYFIYFDVAPADIDVNIHPTKTEIKFENEQAIWQLLVAAVRDAVGQFCEIPTIDFDTEGKPDIPVFDPSRDSVAMPHVSYNPDYNPFLSSSRSEPPTAGSSSGGSASPLSAGAARPASFRSDAGVPDEWESLFAIAAPTSSDAAPGSSPSAPLSTASAGASAATSAPMAGIDEKSPAHYQYKGRYIMTAVKSGLMLIDQHRASVRILYERYMSRPTEAAAIPQRVLFPEVIQFPPASLAVVGQLLPRLSTLGFDLSDLGGGSYAVNAIPAGVDGDPVSLVRTIVDDAMAQGADGVAQGGEESFSASLATSLALSLARSTAVAYGQVLSNDEMEALVDQLFSCSNVNYTPDGQPVLAILPQSAIDALF